MEYKQLISLAAGAKENAYVPYSRFRVGAAALMDSGKVYTGVNVENASYGATNCAERTAIFKAVSEGDKKLKAIAIASDAEDFVYPCGICRQVISEFGDENMEIICSNINEEYKVHKLKELLPNAFKKMKE